MQYCWARWATILKDSLKNIMWVNTEGGLPHDWVIKPTSNGWTNNETGLEWLQHFNKHTCSRAKGPYRMLVLDGHESHESAAFQGYCKANDIITLCLPPHSSHLTQPLDVGCFSVLYGRQIETFIKAHINHTVFGTDTNIPVVSGYILEYIPTRRYLKSIWRIRILSSIYPDICQELPSVAKTSFFQRRETCIDAV
jgi:hypothetical protein